MRNKTCQPIIETLLRHAEERSSWKTQAGAIPVAAYADAEHLANEQRTLFSELPQVVALSPDLPESGSYVTRDAFGFPLLLTRADDGVVRAFANVCAHRGAQVVPDGSGCRRRVSCPYHAWTYELDGALVAVPDAGAFPDVEAPGPGLVPVPVVEDHGVIWAVPKLGSAVSPQPVVGPIGDDLDAFDIANHRHWRSHRFHLDLNWKLVVDTFLEPYHFATLHRDTVGPLFIPNLCHADRFGSHLREVLPRRTLTELRDEPPDSWDIVPHSAIVYVLFPNTVFVMQIDHIETWRVRPHPTDPGRCLCDLDFYVPNQSPTDLSETHWEKNWKLTIDTVDNEDFAAMAGVQRGLASGAIEEIRIGANEPALRIFHDALDEALRSA